MNSIPVSIKMELYMQPATKHRAERIEEYNLLKKKQFILIVSGNNSLQAQWGYKLFHTGEVHSS